MPSVQGGDNSQSNLQLLVGQGWSLRGFQACLRWEGELVVSEGCQSPGAFPHPSLWDCVSSRYQTALVLVRVKQEEGGFYTIRASNEDDEQELSFHLQINGEDGHANMGLKSVRVVSRDGSILCCRTLSLKPFLLCL